MGEMFRVTDETMCKKLLQSCHVYVVLWKLLCANQHQSTVHCISCGMCVMRKRSDFNACDNFFMTVLTSHITVAAMKYLHLESVTGPS